MVLSPRAQAGPLHDGAGWRYSLADLPVPLVFATHRIIRDCNEPFARLLGYERDELLNSSFRQLYPAIGDFARVGDLWKAQLADRLVYFDERVMRRKDGTKLWCRVHGRTSTPADPFAVATYCFEPMQRGVTPGEHMLTARQRQLLSMVAQGLTNARIAEELGLSRRTVEAHRLRLIRAVGVRNTAELMTWFSERAS